MLLPTVNPLVLVSKSGLFGIVSGGLVVPEDVSMVACFSGSVGPLQDRSLGFSRLSLVLLPELLKAFELIRSCEPREGIEVSLDFCCQGAVSNTSGWGEPCPASTLRYPRKFVPPSLCASFLARLVHLQTSSTRDSAFRCINSAHHRGRICLGNSNRCQDMAEVFRIL